MGWGEGEVRRGAADNHAMVDRLTALEQGATGAIISKRVKQGTWRRVYPGVYDLNVTRPTWNGQVRAAVFAAGTHAVVSHRTAAVLWGLDGIRGRVIELTVPFTKDPIPAGVIVHRTRRLLPRSLVDEIPVTDVDRTLLDLAALLPPITLEKAVVSAIHKGLTTPDLLAVRLMQFGGRGVRGTRRLRRTLGLVDDGITGSPSEVDLMALMRSAPIPTPTCQLAVTMPDGATAFPDFSWPDRMKAIEVDGFEAHGSPEALERDLIRQNMLLELGWEIRRFSARRIRRDRFGVLEEIIRFVNG